MQTTLQQNPTALLRYCHQISHVHQIHAHLLKTALATLPFPVSNLLASAAAHSAAYARSIFDSIPTPNLFQYNTILRAYSVETSPTTAPISLFNSLRSSGLLLDQFSFIPTLKICARALAFPTGQQIHAVILSSAFHRFLNLRNTLIHFYCACNRVADAHNLFDEMPTIRDPVSWATLMGGYLQASQHPNTVLALFREMLSSGSNYFNAATIVTTLSAASSVYTGESLHGYCTKTGMSSDLNVATAIITMYSKSGRMDGARRMFEFDHICNWRDVVLYNCMVDGYARAGLLEESLDLLQRMRDEGVKPNSATLVGLFSSCAAIGALGIGRYVHEYAKEERLVLDGSLGTALVDMYSKSGHLEGAIEIFKGMQQRDVKTWTAMIMGLGAHSRAGDALRLFYEMEEQGVRPNEVTFLAILSACSHGGLVTSGKEFFRRMVGEYKLSPRIEHYGCIIDLLGRAGMLEEAHKLIKSLPCEGDATAWRALLAACRVHGDIRLAKAACQALVALGDEHPADSILLSNTYHLAGISGTAIHTEYYVGETTMPKKQAGCSSIELVA